MSGRRTWARRAAGLAMAAFCCWALAGCGASTEGAGGLADSSATPGAAQNLVNPAQLPDSSFIYDASIMDLQTADSYMEGQTVQVTGEAIGDRILSDYDPDECWIVLQAADSDAEITVSMPLAQSKLIDTYGAYGKRGTTLQVRGTFSLACADHDGLTDIHADHVNIVSRGAANDRPFDARRFVPGLLLVGMGAGLTLLYRHLSERRR